MDTDNIMDDFNNFNLDNTEVDDDEDWSNLDDVEDEGIDLGSDSIIDDDNNSSIDVDFGETSDDSNSWDLDFGDTPEDTGSTAVVQDNNEDIDSTDYVDGSIIDIDLHEDVEHDVGASVGADFINSSGNIVVQDMSREDGFEIAYIDIDKIAITNRIRKMESVDALVQSIKSTGLLEPLVVVSTATDDLYVLISGYRRIQACARAGITKVPCVINTKVSTPEIPILEAMYNHQKRYSMKEQIDYIDYLEKEKGIMNPAMIEYLLQMNNGDYTKLKDILNDNDDDIVTKLYDGLYDIATAFKKLEARRKKESKEEKENKLAENVYGDEAESGVDQIGGSGEEAADTPLTEDQIKGLAINPENLDSDTEDMDLAETVADDDKLEGFEKHQQKVGERECIDPAIRKAVLIRDKGTCQCCKLGGPQMVNNLDLHHVLPVFLGGVDSVENSVMLCLNCHRSVHLYSTGDLAIDSALLKDSFNDLDTEAQILYQNDVMFDNLKSTYKKIVKLGGAIRKGVSMRGMNREQYKKDHPNHEIGRRMPGKNAPQTAD